MREAEFNKDPYLKNFGITVDTSMTKVGGRVLEPPEMKCRDKHVKA